MSNIEIPKEYKLIEAYFTFDNVLDYSYDIGKIYDMDNYYNHMNIMSGHNWIIGLNRLNTDIPINLTGGEPTLHQDFYKIVKNIEKPINLITHGQFKKEDFLNKVSSKVFKDKKYKTGIVFLYHSKITPLFPLLKKAKAMKKRGYNVVINAIVNIDCYNDIVYANKIAVTEFDLSFKLFMPNDVHSKELGLFIAPNGDMYKSRYDLYNHRNCYSNLLVKGIKLPINKEDKE